MFDQTFLSPPQEQADDGSASSPGQSVADAVQSLREAVVRQANALVEQFMEERARLQKTIGDGFIGTTFSVRERNDGRSIQLAWGVAHFRAKRFTGMTSVPKKRGDANYDLAKLKGVTPPWAHELVIETEMKARLLRDVLMRLTEMDTALQVVTRRLEAFDIAAPASNDPFPDDDDEHS